VYGCERCAISVKIRKVDDKFNKTEDKSSKKSERTLMTRTEVMVYLRVSKRTFDKMMKSENIPHFRLKKKLLFRESEIENWRESKRVK